MRTFTERFLTYALGRVVDYRDMPAVRKIVRDAKRDNYKFSALVWEIVTSEPFQMRQAPAAAAPPVGDGANGFDELEGRARKTLGRQEIAMFISKKHLSRRTVLRGAGAVIALPLLDAMVPAMCGANAKPTPQRLAFVGFPHGAVMRHWSPAETGKDYEMTKILEPLAPYRQL